jgi:hypothetical protein
MSHQRRNVVHHCWTTGNSDRVCVVVETEKPLPAEIYPEIAHVVEAGSALVSALDELTSSESAAAALGVGEETP